MEIPALQGMRCMMFEIIVLVNLYFFRPHEAISPCFQKSHSGKRC